MMSRSWDNLASPSRQINCLEGQVIAVPGIESPTVSLETISRRRLLTGVAWTAMDDYKSKVAAGR